MDNFNTGKINHIYIWRDNFFIKFQFYWNVLSVTSIYLILLVSPTNITICCQWRCVQNAAPIGCLVSGGRKTTKKEENFQYFQASSPLYKCGRLQLCLWDWFRFAGFNTAITASQITTDSTQGTHSLLNFWLLKWNKMKSPNSLLLFSLPRLRTVFPWIYFPLCDWVALYWHPHPDGKNNPISQFRVHLPTGLAWGPWRRLCNRHPNGVSQSPQLAPLDADEQRRTFRLPPAVPSPHPSPVTHLASVTWIVLMWFWFVSMSWGVSVQPVKAGGSTVAVLKKMQVNWVLVGVGVTADVLAPLLRPPTEEN